MSKVKVTNENFDVDKLSAADKEDLKDFIKGLQELAVEDGGNATDVDEKEAAKEWLKNKPDIFYEETAKPSADISKLMERMSAAKRRNEPVTKDPADDPNKVGTKDSKGDDGSSIKVTVDDSDATAAAKAAKLLEEEAAEKERQRLKEEEIKKKADEEAEAERKRKEAAEKLKSLEGLLVQNPVSVVKLKDLKDFKDVPDVGIKAAMTKFKVSLESNISGFSKTLKPLKAGDVNFDQIHWDSREGEMILAVCWYACVNGPVGVNKPTKFGSLAETVSIRKLFESAGHVEPVTNTMWRKFCRIMVDLIDTTKPEVKSGKMYATYKKLWPLCDSEMVTQAEYKVSKKNAYLSQNAEAFESNI